MAKSTENKLSKKAKNKKLATRIVAWVLAALFILGAIAVIIPFI